MKSSASCTRVVLVQPSLAKYRVPVYKTLAKRSGFSLFVVYGETSGIPNVSPDGFKAAYSPLYKIGFGFGHLLWHGAQYKYAKKTYCDVLVLSWDLHYLTLIPALLRAKFNGVATVLWGHAYSKRERNWRAVLRKIPALLADRLLFYSSNPAKNYIEKFGFASHRVLVAPNALDQSAVIAAIDSWASQPEKMMYFREMNGLIGKRVIIFCSRLDSANRVDLLLHAAKLLASRIGNLHVVIVGTGVELNNLKSLSITLNLCDRVTFAGPIYDEDRLAPWFLASEVFCYPENIGLSLLHAFGYALPVVTSDKFSAHNPEIEAFRPNRNGLLYKHGDIEDFACSVGKLLEDEILRKKLSEEARRTVREDYSLESMVNGFEAALKI